MTCMSGYDMYAVFSLSLGHKDPVTGLPMPHWTGLHPAFQKAWDDLAAHKQHNVGNVPPDPGLKIC